MRAESDLDLEALQTLMACWQTCYEDKSVDAKKVAQDLKLYTANDGVVKWCDLQEAIRTFSPKAADRQLTSLQIADRAADLQGPNRQRPPVYPCWWQ